MPDFSSIYHVIPPLLKSGGGFCCIFAGIVFVSLCESGFGGLSEHSLPDLTWRAPVMRSRGFLFVYLERTTQLSLGKQTLTPSHVRYIPLRDDDKARGFRPPILLIPFVLPLGLEIA